MAKTSKRRLVQVDPDNHAGLRKVQQHYKAGGINITIPSVLNSLLRGVLKKCDACAVDSPLPGGRGAD